MHGRSKPKSAPKATLLPAFEELRPTLDVGDVLLFSGGGRFSNKIKRFLRSHWSHVALVAREKPGGPLYLWEATQDSDLPDVVSRTARPGVGLFDLETWILHYASETAIRPLHVERTAKMRADLLAFFREVHGRPYERRRLELLRASGKGPWGPNPQPNLSSLFCSELVAEAYQRMGLLPRRPPSNCYTPRDFSSERPQPLPLRLGATLGEEVVVCAAGG
jgi:hypothetical protein